MTPERKEFANTRIVRLTEKLTRIDADLKAVTDWPNGDKFVALKKEHRSTLTAINRWKKELAAA
jgi:hypothetical protein